MLKGKLSFLRAVIALTAMALAFFVCLYMQNASLKNMPAVSASAAALKKEAKKEHPIYCVSTDKKQIALSFDAAWGNKDTGKILDILKKHDIRATFFMTGGWVESYPENVKQIAAAGHDLGNHSEHHRHMTQLSSADNQSEIMSAHNRVKSLTGIEMQLFRPPYGDYNNELITTLKNSGYYPIQWSIDSLDWKNYGRDKLISTILEHKSLDNGAIILMHNGAKYTAEALDAIITGLKNKGYELVPISELIYRDNYTVDHTGKQIPAKTKAPEKSNTPQ